MASIDPKAIILEDRWPGKVNPNQGKPGRGLGLKDWDMTQHATAQFTPGEKIQAFNDYSDNVKGYYTMAYLQFKEGATLAEDCDSDLTNDLAMCAYYDQSNPIYWRVTNDVTESDMTESGRIAIAASDISDGGYGWFWVGGVCPVADITKWDITGLLTDGKLAAGHPMFPGDTSGQGILNSGDPTDIIDLTIGQIQNGFPCGWALEDDT